MATSARPHSRPADTAGRGWGRLLALLILAICLGPRIRVGAIGGKDADLRVQDFLIALLIVAIFGSSGAMRPKTMRAAWGMWGVTYAALITMATLLLLFFDPTQPLARTGVYLGRNLEILVLAWVVAALYVRAGDHARAAALRALHLAAWANGLWVAYQYATSTSQVLIGATSTDGVISYGPRLIGEASAFGTGFFFTLVTCVGAAEFRTRGTGSRLHPLLLVALGLVGTVLAQSRLSMIGAALIVTLLVLSPRRNSFNAFGATAVAGLSVAAYLGLPANLQGRLSPDGIEMSFHYRVESIWNPLVDVILAHPLIGIGPGSLGTTDYPWTEAHNILLRAALDYGLFGAFAFAALLVTVLVRSRRAAESESDEIALFGSLAVGVVLAVLVAGMLQESMAAVMSSHLTMLAVGLLAGSLARRSTPTKPASGVPRQVARI